MSVWTLKVGDETRSIAGWGIDWDSLQLTFNSWDADELNFAMTKATVLEDPVFSFAEDVILYKDSTPWFVGKVVQPSAQASSIKEVQRFTCKNVWAQLEDLQYEQEHNTKSADDGFTDYARVLMTRVVLGSRLGETGVTKIDTKNQMEDLLAWAVAEGLPLAYNVDFSGLTPPYEEAKDMSVAAAMRRMAAWTPDCATRFDYSTTPPTLYIRRRPGATTRTLDLLAVEVGGLVEFGPLKGDFNLVPTGVEIAFVSSVENPADNLRYQVVSKLASGVFTGIDRSRLLRGTIFLAGDGTIDAEATPEELAADYAAALSEVFWNGPFTFVHPEVPGTYRTGNLINATNGQTAWTTMKAIVQSVQETPARGMTVVTCGRPPMLSTGTLAELQRRISNVANNAGTVSSVYSGYSSSEPRVSFTSVRTLTFDLSGYLEGNTPALVGSATFRVTIHNRVACTIELTAWALAGAVDGIPLTYVSWIGYDVTEAATISSTTYVGVPTGTYKINFVFNGTLPNFRGPHTVPSSFLVSTLKVTLNANP